MHKNEIVRELSLIEAKFSAIKLAAGNIDQVPTSLWLEDSKKKLLAEMLRTLGLGLISLSVRIRPSPLQYTGRGNDSC